ncbi:MAG: NlpC/P60 family protein [Chthoniobacteraceae bacterium]
MNRSATLFLSFMIAVLLGEPLHAAVDDSPKKRGGFKTSATPTPKPKKTNAAEDTPSPKKKTLSEDASGDKKSATPRPSGKAKSSEPVASKKKTKASEKSSEVETVSAAPAAVEKQSATTPSANADTQPAKPERAPAASLAPAELAEFAGLPPRTQALIAAALELTKLNLTYTYGSDDPAQGGMDCSGTMAYVLRAQGFKDVPRDSSSQYVWARKGGPFFAVVSKSAESFEFKDLQPGDLLFWTGTYETGREIPISHVMLYLGTEKKTKKRVMFGASDGRSYAGIQRWGVSVFDFKMPNGTAANGERTKVDFVGYGRIPGLREIAAPEPVAEKTLVASEREVVAAATPKPRNTTKPATSSSGTRKKKRSE